MKKTSEVIATTTAVPAKKASIASATQDEDLVVDCNFDDEFSIDSSDEEFKERKSNKAQVAGERKITAKTKLLKCRELHTTTSRGTPPRTAENTRILTNVE